MIKKEELQELYINQDMTQAEVGKRLGYSVSSVRNYLRKYGMAKAIKLVDRWAEIESEIRAINPKAELISLKDASQPLVIKCSCGKEFKRALGCIKKYQSCLCYDCTGWKGSSNGYSDAEVREYIESKGCELLAPYEHINKKLLLRCHCGNEFNQTYTVFRRGNHQGCSKCFHEKEHDKQRHSVEDVHKIVQEAGCEWVSGEYMNLKSEIGVTCFSCKKEYQVCLDKFVYQHKVRCNGCTTNRSTYEIYLEHLLKEMGVDFLMDKHLPGALGGKGGKLRFDFIILVDGEPSKVIEVDGMQHYRNGGNKGYFNDKQKFEERMDNDRRKESYAIENNLPMLRLSYKLFRSVKKKKVLFETLETFIEEDATTEIKMVS